MIDVKERIKKYTNEDGKFVWDMGTVMNHIRPNCMFEISMQGGQIELSKWEEFNNWSDETQDYIKRPSNLDIIRELVIQETIAETLQFLEQNK
jgi:hypothetical protein